MSDEEEVQEKQRKRPTLLRLSLVGILLAVLALGFLYHTGMIDPSKMLKLGKMVKARKSTSSLKSGGSKSVTRRRTTRVSVKPKPATSNKTTRIQAKNPISSSAFVPKDSTEIDSRASGAKISLYPYSLYLGSYRTRERAEKAISIYAKEGLSPYSVKMDFKEKGIWFRVYTGYFKDKEGAETFKLESHLREASVKNTQYANLIGTYPSDTISLRMKIRSLKKLGYSPYVIEGGGGKLRVYVGGFFRKDRAVTLHDELKSQGMTSQIVKR